MPEKSRAAVCIGMPVYNGADSMSRALDSLLAQDFSDFDLIISDNCSTDATEEICRTYAARDVRVHYIRQPENIGGIANFNFLLTTAQSEFFMWAAADDLWKPAFISTLIHALQKDPSAVGAFCPYQLFADETGDIEPGVWTCDYQDTSAFRRLVKFTRQYRDTCIYGLMRRERLQGLRFIPWSGVNSTTPYNLVYPALYFLLARGNFLQAGSEPLWLKSITVSHWHAAPYQSAPFLAYLAHVSRKINLFVRSVRYIKRGSGSTKLAGAMVPILFARLARDSFIPAYAAVRIWLSGRKISQLSPHEIWQMGVR